MVAKEQLHHARALIAKKRYVEARAILVQIDHPKAREWITRIDAITGADLDFPEVGQEPARAKKEKSGGPSCLKLGLGVGCVAPGMFCVGVVVICVIIAALIQAGKETATREGIERNGGRGSYEQPIVAQQWAIFEKGRIRATRVIRPADQTVEGFSVLNDESSAGADYVLVWFELACDSDKCNSNQLDLRLMETRDDAYGERLWLYLRDDFDNQEAFRGGVITGWQCFEFPSNHVIQTIKVEWGAETLHLQPPG